MSSDLLKENILRLKKQKNAVILAHNYQNDEIQEIADYTGDSLGLSREAASVKCSIIVFCGVYFMAETAKILSPNKKVIIPDKTAGCPMADMITAQQLRDLKAKYTGSPVVCYVNSTAEVKAESDICCTSANAVEVVNSLDDKNPILFVPDKNLGAYIKEITGKNIIVWPGYCPTHAKIEPQLVDNAKERFPNAIVLVHPECDPEVVLKSNHTMSTGQMIKFVKTSEHKEFIIGTEKGILYMLNKENKNKDFHILSKNFICPNMKKVSLNKLYKSLDQEIYEITVEKEIAKKAKLSIDRMLKI